jgi:hypothetical protein
MNYLDIYSDFLLISSDFAHSTLLAEISDNSVSKDKIYRFLSSDSFSGKNYWLKIKPFVKKVQSDDGVLIFDDTIIEKPFSKTNAIISYYFDHSEGKAIKGINLLSCIYQTQNISIPLAFDIVKKTKEVRDKNGDTRLKPEKTKNELLRENLYQVKVNRVKFKYVLADSWYCNKDTLNLVGLELKKYFVFAIKSNQSFKFLNETKESFRKINKGNFKPNTVYRVNIKGVKFPVSLIKLVFKNEDNEAVLYVVTNDDNLDYDGIKITYQRRWVIEEYHKSIKQNCSLGKSLVRTLKTIKGHIYSSVYSFLKLEKLKIKTRENHFKIIRRIYIEGLRICQKKLKTI